MISPLRSLGLLLCGFTLGVMACGTVLGRYTVTTAGAGGPPALIHAYRLDRFTGQVIGMGGISTAYGTKEIDAWNASSEPANPYLDLRPKASFDWSDVAPKEK